MFYQRPYQIFASISCSFALVAIGFKVFGDLKMTSAESARMADLREIGNRKNAGACLELDSKNLLTLGTPIQLPPGRSPTSCFHNAATRQYAYAGYLQGQLTITRIFTEIEIKRGVQK